MTTVVVSVIKFDHINAGNKETVYNIFIYNIYMIYIHSYTCPAICIYKVRQVDGGIMRHTFVYIYMFVCVYIYKLA